MGADGQCNSTVSRAGPTQDRLNVLRKPVLHLPRTGVSVSVSPVLGRGRTVGFVIFSRSLNADWRIVTLQPVRPSVHADRRSRECGPVLGLRPAAITLTPVVMLWTGAIALNECAGPDRRPTGVKA